MYDNHIVCRERSIKYLGVILDEMLTYEEHIDAVIEKAITYFNKFSPLLTSTTLSIETKRLLYTMIIRPIMAKGSVICTKASPDVLNKLYRLQQRILCLSFNLPPAFSPKLIEKISGIPCLSIYLDRVNRRFGRKCNESDFPLIKEINLAVCRRLAVVP